MIQKAVWHSAMWNMSMCVRVYCVAVSVCDPQITVLVNQVIMILIYLKLHYEMSAHQLKRHTAPQGEMIHKYNKER